MSKFSRSLTELTEWVDFLNNFGQSTESSHTKIYVRAMVLLVELRRQSFRSVSHPDDSHAVRDDSEFPFERILILFSHLMRRGKYKSLARAMRHIESQRNFGRSTLRHPTISLLFATLSRKTRSLTIKEAFLGVYVLQRIAKFLEWITKNFDI